MGYTLFGFCDRFASYWMSSPDDPQFCVISKGGSLTGLGPEPVKGGRPEQQAVLPENQAFPIMSMDNGKQENVLCSPRRQLGHNKGEKNKSPANGI